VGNKAFDEKNYIKAKEMFNRAVNFRPADQYPKQRLQQIADLEKEEKLAQDQLSQFNKKMAEADGLAKANKLEEAITAYKAAKTIKPDDLLPDQKISELQNLLANKVDPAAEEQKLYDAAMSRGNNAAFSKDYNGAISQYEEALRHKAKDQTAVNKIAEMRQILDDLAKANAANKELESMIAAADKEFNDSKWTEAKTAYDNILSRFPSNSYAYEQAKKCEIKLKEKQNEDIERVYRNLLSGADDKFNNQKYDKAKELYERAVTQRPNDPYPKQKLKEIQNIQTKPVASKSTATPKNNQIELKSLGEETDNSLDEGAKKLQAANDQRKKNKTRKMVDKLRGTTDKSEELTEKQNTQTLAADSTFGEIRIDNSIRNEAANAKVQNNVDVMKEKTSTLVQATEESNTIKELNIVDQKQQLEAANQAVIVTNSALDGAAIDNDEVLKRTTSQLGAVEVEMTNEKYSEIAKNEVAYATIRANQEKNSIDDFEERLAEEKKVKDASMVQADLTVKTSDKAAAKTVETKEVLKDVENNISVKTTEDKVLSENNDNKLKEIEKVTSANKVESDQTHLENTQRFADKTSQMEKSMYERNASRQDAQNGNVEVVEAKRDEKTEIDRADFNKAYVKNIENKQLLNEKTREIEKRNELPSIAAAENKKDFTEIQNASTESQLNQQAKNDTKIIENNTKLTSTQTQIEDNTGKNAHATENDLLIKNSKNELGTNGRIQTEKNVERSAAAQKTLDGIEAKQPEKKTVGAYDIDLTKYKEGVNQEQFDQLGPDGLVSAVVTRRVVVTDGKANVYIRTQTLDVLTYSKNGQPCTELVWQRETQDAKLKRNY
jgi:hypothetical protein